jgi:hypothetical protein
MVGTDSAARQGATSVTITAAQAAATKGVFKAGTYAVDEDFAVLCYELNTRLDTYSGTYKPTDSGSDGLAAAKTLRALGLADTYTHGFSIAALDSALQAGPVMLGTVWLNSMFDTDSSGNISVVTSSGEAGGHELVISELDVERGKYGLDNSWAADWGQDGRGFVTRSQMAWLLSQQGDVTVPHMLGGSTPTPTPAPADVDHAMAAAARAWLTSKGL